MGISANTLFHFTNFENLRSIIRDGFFLPHYSFEMFNCQEEFIVAYPMVCFCDISLSQISEHAEYYHKNGIGLSKVWGQENKINPVLYIQKESYVHDLLLNLLNKQNFQYKNGDTYLKISNPLLREKIWKLFELSAFFKPSKGKIWNKANRSFEIKSSSGRLHRLMIRNFYNEREWRYVPEILTQREQNNKLIPINFVPEMYFLDSKERFSPNILANYNSKLLDKKLKFKVTNIKYIIVEDSSILNELAEEINFLDNYSKLDKNKLVTKIITLRQIREDF